MIADRAIVKKLLNEAINLEIANVEDIKKMIKENFTPLNESVLLTSLIAAVIGLISGLTIRKNIERTFDVIDKTREKCSDKCLGTAGIEQEICIHQCALEYYTSIYKWAKDTEKRLKSDINMNESERRKAIAWMQSAQEAAKERIDTESNILNDLIKQKKDEEMEARRLNIRLQT